MRLQFFVFLFLAACAQQSLLDQNIKGHSQVAMHIHPLLEIKINGEQYPIPAHTGVSMEGMRMIHTHDGSGKLHVEPPIPHEFVLGDFFYVWGKNFNDSCIFDFCTNGSHEMRVMVRGQQVENPSDWVLKDHEQIRIVYAER